MIPKIRLTDPAFKYTPSYLTDVSKTFKKAKAEMEKSGVKIKVIRVRKV